MIRLILLPFAASLLAAAGPEVKDLRIRVLSTMLADTAGIGEWGFAALVEADGRRILFDTGARPQTVIANTAEMGIDLAGITDVILSHNHGDHTGGLITLRRSLAAKDRNSLSVAHVGRGIFWKRRGSMPQVKAEYEATGARFVEYDKPRELVPGVWLTGPIPRKYPERNWGGTGRVESPQGEVEDTVPEDMAMVVRTARGLVVLSGCGHAGIVNTLDYAREVAGPAPVYAAIGGFHLFQLDDEKLAWTAAKLKEFRVENFLGTHCTGIEATYRIRQLNGMPRSKAAVGAVGAVFDLQKGMNAGAIAR